MSLETRRSGDNLALRVPEDATSLAEYAGDRGSTVGLEYQTPTDPSLLVTTPEHRERQLGKVIQGYYIPASMLEQARDHAPEVIVLPEF